jgi:tubulin polyglutamylase TTLL7
MKKQKYCSSDSSYDSSSSSSEFEENEKEDCQDKKREKQVPYTLKHTNNCKLIQQASKLVSSNLVDT